MENTGNIVPIIAHTCAFKMIFLNCIQLYIIYTNNKNRKLTVQMYDSYFSR